MDLPLMAKMMQVRYHGWFAKQASDPFVREAKRLDYRSRAAFKLLQLNAKYNFIQPGSRVLDLGAAPGGWSQVASHIVGARGAVLAVDLLGMEPIQGVKVMRGDFTSEAVRTKMRELIPEANVILSDAAPNLTGISIVDQEAALDLNKAILAIAQNGQLRPGGSLVFKAFRSPVLKQLESKLQSAFAQVLQAKPEASRKDSAETYFICKRLKQQQKH